MSILEHCLILSVEKMSAMDPICEALCSLNDKNQPGQRHLIAISFDHPNHGGRLVHRASNFAWKEGKHENPMHAQDMWSMYHSSASTVSQLIDVVEDYLFGPQEQSRVQVWGVMGFSMGGHATFLAAASGKKNKNHVYIHLYSLHDIVDPRISVAIPIVGTADFLSLLRDRLSQSSLSEKDHLPRRFCEMVDAKTANLDIRLKNTKLLMMSGAKDQLVPGKFNLDLVNRLKKTHTGQQGRDWAFVIVPNCGHEWSKTMFDLSVAWVDQWMVQTSSATSNIETTLKAHL